MTSVLDLSYLQEQLSLYISGTIRASCGDVQLRKADERRHTVSAKDLWRKVRDGISSVWLYILLFSLIRRFLSWWMSVDLLSLLH